VIELSTLPFFSSVLADELTGFITLSSRYLSDSHRRPLPRAKSRSSGMEIGALEAELSLTLLLLNEKASWYWDYVQLTSVLKSTVEWVNITVHLRLRSLANRRARMKAMTENTLDILEG
jgi:hypothetical protein